MKRCTETHHVASFGRIPAGSLWADDSPHIGDDNAAKFVDVDDTPAPPKKRAATRKFGDKKAST